MKHIFYFSILFLILLGFGLRVFAYNGGGSLMTFGLLIVLIYFIIKLIEGIVSKNQNLTTMILNVVLILMSITLFARYLYYMFWDFPGIIIVPAFIIFSTKYLLSKAKKNIIVMSTIFVYCFLTIPLFGLEFYKNPRFLIPKEWYNRYDVANTYTITLPWTIESMQAKILNDSAFALNESKKYEKAILVYKEALNIEFNPSILFEFSTALANANRLDEAIAYADTLISIDPTFSASYTNRGLLYYKLKENEKAIADYKKAINLRPNFPPTHSNLALAYYYNKEYTKSCQHINISSKLGLNLRNDPIYKPLIKKMKCVF
jgi:hypothetical protein